MNIYIDLSIVFLILNAVLSLFVVQILTCKKYSFLDYVIISIINAFSILFVYSFNLIFFIIFLIIHFLFFLKKGKNAIYLNLFLYLFFNYLIPMFLLLFFDSLKLVNGRVFIISPTGILAYLGIFVVGGMFYISSKVVDYLYRLHKFKEDVILTIEKRKIKISAYYDSGNFAKYNGIPVVFIKLNSYPYELNPFTHHIEIKTINGNKKFLAAPALLTRIGNDDSTFVYVCIDDNKGSYHGCELLLNAYLL